MRKHILFVVSCAGVLAFAGCTLGHGSRGGAGTARLSEAVRSEEPATQAAARKQLAGLRIPFIANRGQAADDVTFYAPTFAGTVFVTTEGRLVYALGARKGAEPAQGVALTEELVGGTVHEVTGKDRARTAVNVFRGSDPAAWRSNLATYDTLSLGEVYPGIEMTLRASGNTVEKLFEVRPGAQPAQIRIKVTGGRGVAVTERGELDVETARGTVRFSKPIAYQGAGPTRQSIAVAYVVDGEAYGFRVGAYDPSKPLVIDPILTATFLGGNATDTAVALALDGAGNVYVTGSTASFFPGIDQDSPDFEFAPFEGFVAKLNADLTVIQAATYLGGSSDDVAEAIALDGLGNVYVAGSTLSADFPGLPAGQSVGGVGDAFVVKLDANLSQILAATLLGGTGLDDAHAIAVDGAGNVYVAGSTFSSDFPGIAAGQTPLGGGDAFIAKLDADLGQVSAAMYLGGSSNDVARAIALDGTGTIYVAGRTRSSDFRGVGPRSGSADHTFSDSDPNFAAEAFVARVDADLSKLLAATFLGGSAADSALALAVNAGHVYVAGSTDSADFPGIGPGSADPTFAGAFDGFGEGFVVKLNDSLSTILAATYLGGNSFDGASALAVDGSGNVYVAGATNSFDFPGAGPGSADALLVGLEAFIAKLNADLGGGVLAATFLGGSGNDFARALAINAAGQVYVAGGFAPLTLGSPDSVDFPGIGSASADPTTEGFGEGFVARLDALVDPGFAIVQKLKDLVDSCFPCPPFVEQTLLDHVDLVMKQALKGNGTAAVSLLKVFVKKTERFVASGDVPANLGQRVIGLAEEMVAAFSADVVGVGR